MAFRTFPDRLPAPEPDAPPRPFGRRPSGALDEPEAGADWAGKAKLAAFVAGCAVLGALAAGVI